MSRSDREEVEQYLLNEVIRISKKEVIFIIGGGEIYRLFLHMLTTDISNDTVIVKLRTQTLLDQY